MKRKKKEIKTTYDISLDSQISLLPLGFSLHRGDISSEALFTSDRKDILCEFIFLPFIIQILGENYIQREKKF